MLVPSLSSRRLVGRNEELEALGEARRGLSAGRGAVVLVGGEAGIGKTRLLAEFARSLSGGRAPHYALGECLEHAPRPFGPFRSILLALARASPAALEGADAVVRRTFEALVPDLTGGAVAPVRAVEKSELFAGVLRFLETVAAKRATVIALEDLHWADSASLELLRHLAPRIAGTRVLIVATHRDIVEPEHPLFGALGRLTREATVRTLALEPLHENDVRELIESALGERYTLDAERVRELIERSEGNPFFAEELLKKALETRRGATHGALPISIRAMILERLSGLDPADRHALDRAAVLGARFEAPLLAKVLRRDTSEVLASLQRLRDVGLVREEREPRPQFRFRHALTRQTVYDELLAADTRALHAELVALLEAQPAADDYLDELAYHAWCAGLADATLRHNERAGDVALRVRAAAQAATYYRRALETAVDPEVRLRLLEKTGEAVVQQGDFERSIAVYLELREARLARADLDGAALATIRAAGEMMNSGRNAEAATLLETFREAYGARLEARTLDYVYASLARSATNCGDFAGARTLLAKVARPDDLLPRAHHIYWVSTLFCAEEAVDVESWRAAVAALRGRLGEIPPMMRAQILHSIGNTGVDLGETREAERSVDEAIAIDREYGFIPALVFATMVRGLILHARGRLAETRRCAEFVLSEPEPFVARVQLAAYAPLVALALDDDALAARCLDDEAFLRRVLDSGYDRQYAAILGAKALWLAGKGRLREARPLFASALSGPQHGAAIVNVWPLAARYVEAGQLETIRLACAERAANPQDVVARATLALIDAHLARRRGDVAASDHAETARARYASLGWRLHEAVALELLGRTEDALEIYRECGSVADVRRLELAAPEAAGVSSEASGVARTAAAGGLSPREREVARLIARGYANRAIADELGVGLKTIEKYITAIYAKLNLSSRAELAAHVARDEAGLPVAAAR
jgi:DNA-binding CsgD family transcriptional regulator/tetratricopeptide (TPR) repeat protein